MDAAVSADRPCAGETPSVGISTLVPTLSEEEFTELVTEMVADEAPRLFAVVQEYGQRVDGRIAAWGIALEDRAMVVDVDGGATMNLRPAKRAAWVFSRRPNITARVVWVDRSTATPLNEIVAI